MCLRDLILDPEIDPIPKDGHSSVKSGICLPSPKLDLGGQLMRLMIILHLKHNTMYFTSDVPLTVCSLLSAFALYIMFFMPRIFEPIVRLSFPLKSTFHNTTNLLSTQPLFFFSFLFLSLQKPLFRIRRLLCFLSTALCMYVNLFFSLSLFSIGSLVYAALQFYRLGSNRFYISYFQVPFIYLPFSCCLLDPSIWVFFFSFTLAFGLLPQRQWYSKLG